VNLPAGLAVALGILTVLPLAAVAVGRRWRDPPPERWGISPERRAAAANSPELIAYRRRIELGIADPRNEAVVNQAIRAGTAAPPELRAATRELAGLRTGELDRRLRKAGVWFAFWIVLGTVLLGVGAFARSRSLCVYGVLSYIRAYLGSPWQLRQLRARAESAVVANAAG
jgi:hypothetical protein